ncbi:hypothetical protein QYE76_058820 [Lolium multiflorum]|uniref:CCHC-type domain-containing protein n=1 Tax=Lolium multiflorum TaxID=4521 RepID=A0AAD8WQC3_LOLMU|nr:hypothetical protein QYE76_058820 [Lolium multiflorum]
MGDINNSHGGGGAAAGATFPVAMYEEGASIARGGEEQLDQKMDVKLDMELDMKTSHGRAREKREECARGEAEVQAGTRSSPTGRAAGPSGPSGPTGSCAVSPVSTAALVPSGHYPYARSIARSPSGASDHKIVNQENKDSADIITWREYEALRNEMRREFRTPIDELKGTVQGISQKLDTTCETVTTMKDQMTDIQRNIADMRLAIENLTAHQQQEDDEDPELQDDAHNARGAPRGNRPPLGRNGRGQDEEDGLGVKTVDEYYMEMEMLMQRGRVRESLEMTMQRFLNGLKYVHSYINMNQLLHHAREAESQLADEAKVKGHTMGAGHFTPRAPPSTAPAPSTRSAPYSTPPSKSVSNVSNTKKSESAASTSGSNMSTARNRDMACHTCGGKGHFKRDCPNRKVMIINEDNEYETGDDVDPNAPEDDDYDTDGEDAYPSEARTIVVSQRALNVLPSASTQRCNLFQTKALVGPDKACKVIIDGGSCRNLASKELCTKLKLKYLPHPHPYYIQWLSDNGEMKVNHMVRVEFAIGPNLATCFRMRYPQDFHHCEKSNFQKILEIMRKVLFFQKTDGAKGKSGGGPRAPHPRAARPGGGAWP